MRLTMRTRGWSATGSNRSIRSGAGSSQRRCRKCWGLEQAGFGEGVEVDDAVPEGLEAVAVEAEVAEAQGVEHGGGRRLPRIARSVGDHGGAGGPAGVGAGLHLAFQVVGMKVDDAGHEGVAAAVDGAGDGGGAGLDVGDTGAVEHDGAVQDGRRAGRGVRW